MSLDYEKEEIPERQITPEEFLRDQKSSIRRKSWWAIGIGSFLILAHLLLFSLVIFSEEFSEMLSWKDLFKSIFFILGLFALVGGIWGLNYAKKLTLQDLIPSPEAIEFARQAEFSRPIYTVILVGSIVAVMLAQYSVGLEESIEIAAFDKPAFVEKSQWWRILTGGALHGGILHIYFNGQALYGFGSLIEFLSNRAHLAIVFLLAVIGGGILSLIFMPEGVSVGASGGIMGLIGYLAIYGYRRKQQLPPDFLKSMLINIGFIAAFGLVAYQIIDNFGHLGGLLVGAIYGFVQVPRDLHKNPRNTNAAAKIFGVIALGMFVATCVFSILLLLKII
jgi:rhomboid protease GluP